MTSATVPDELLGCWQRRWITFADGTHDDTSFVVWLQLPSLMADVRLSEAAVAVATAGRASFDECSLDELRLLADSDSSSGSTKCTPIVVGADGLRRATAEWSSCVSFQPVAAFPEPGLLEWNDTGTVLIERAPSGAYVEEWHLLPGSRGSFAHHHVNNASEWCRAGDFGVLVTDQRQPASGGSRLTDMSERGELEAAIGCEFSFAVRSAAGSFTVAASTLPWRVGTTLALP